VFTAQSRLRAVYRPSELRKLNGSEQVAAVCFRVAGSGIEFLLVRTRGGRWTFPKGCTEPGLTHAQAAALEAFEEAGVHGRMEEASFARYMHRKGAGRKAERREVTVHAHLCEVLRLGRPKESNRHPTWFPVEKAKRRLREDRAPECGVEVLRIVDAAVARIQLLRRRAQCEKNLQDVRLEALEGRVGTTFSLKHGTPVRLPRLTSGSSTSSGVRR
jgi:8-oxo-dGTP pyrophosphatase MutT (NUDIX family)